MKNKDNSQLQVSIPIPMLRRLVFYHYVCIPPHHTNTIYALYTTTVFIYYHAIAIPTTVAIYAERKGSSVLA